MVEKKQIKERIKATEKTHQITEAMNMVSTAKLRRAERTLKEFTPISNSIKETMNSLLLNNPDLSHKALEENDRKPCYIIIASDRGLIGNYNNALFKFFESYIKEHHKSKDEFYVATIGYKAYSYAKRHGLHQVNSEPNNIRDDVLFVDFEDVATSIVDGYAKDKVGKTTVFYQKYINTMTSKITIEQVLPVIAQREKGDKDNIEYIFEPTKEVVLEQLIKLDVSYNLFRIILEAKTSEHASRMNAMKNASDNAKEIEEKLTLLYNHARQNQITTELTDIINGSNAIS
ncbi:MAG: ATP synthase F1 subunit gamma [Gammaproteobacteria bacterium]|nr:ATP synthase F1 subunit gamma [Gammaproteobacteria bacterium]